MLIYLGSIFVDPGIFSVVHESILQHEVHIINELPGLGIPMVIKLCHDGTCSVCIRKPACEFVNMPQLVGSK